MSKILIEIVSGCEGNSVYINDYRLAGPKPWGGGKVLTSVKANLLYLIPDMERCLNDLKELRAEEYPDLEVI